jgi:hypothetical protein
MPSKVVGIAGKFRPKFGVGEIVHCGSRFRDRCSSPSQGAPLENRTILDTKVTLRMRPIGFTLSRWMSKALFLISRVE